MSENNETSQVRQYLLFAAGIATGVAAGLVLAPKSGAEMRRALVDKAEEGAQYVQSQTNRIGASPAEVLLGIKDFWLKHRDEITAVINLARRFSEEVLQNPRRPSYSAGD